MYEQDYLWPYKQSYGFHYQRLCVSFSDLSNDPHSHVIHEGHPGWAEADCLWPGRLSCPVCRTWDTLLLRRPTRDCHGRVLHTKHAALNPNWTSVIVNATIKTNDQQHSKIHYSPFIIQFVGLTSNQKRSISLSQKFGCCIKPISKKKKCEALALKNISLFLGKLFRSVCMFI